MKRFPLLLSLLALSVWSPLPAAESESKSDSPKADSASPAVATNPSYQLATSDQINVSVFGEPDLTGSQKIDAKGCIRLGLIGEIEVAFKTVRDAEHYIEQLYVEKRLLKKPMVTITVQSYVIREVSLIGAIRTPGKMIFPPEKTSLDIVEVITRAGGFLPTAKSDSVKITRVEADGRETTTEINVEAMMFRRNSSSTALKEFAILPGDRIWVPERLF